MTAPFSFLAETHTAVVVGMGDRVLKFRKPLDLGFLDQRTVAQRWEACRREVELNRRFSPDVYLGVGTFASPEDGVPDEPLVVMRRLPADRRLSHLASTGERLVDEVRQIAHLLAAHHGVAPSPPSAREAASPDVTRRRWETNAREMERWVGSVLDADVFERARALATRYLAGRRPLLERRISDGWARDGHGDLLADDIFCLDDGPRILDCLDFDERLRVGDVLADAAFLAMDLERLGRPELGWLFLRTHAELLDDHWPDTLAHHHIAYRAQVRTKVSCIRAEQGDEGARELARRLFSMVHEHLRRATVRVVLVGGAPGTGKTTVSEAVGDALGYVVLRSDAIRKELAGLAPLERTGADLDHGIYRTEHTHATYTELLARARRLLVNGCSVVLDASWRDEAHRAEARALAHDTHAVIVELECTARDEIADERIARRAQHGLDASDADAGIARSLRERAAPWPEATRVDTSTAAPGTSRDQAVAAIDDAC